MYKPQGHSTVSPYLIVRDAMAVADFLQATFGARQGLVHRDGERVAHCEVHLDDSVIMIGEAEGGQETHVHVYVPDADAAFAKAIAAGASVVQSIDEQGDGDRRGGVRDASGTTWWISTHLGPRG